MKCFKCEKPSEYIVQGHSICYSHFVQIYRTKQAVLEESCICSPDRAIGEATVSVCGFPCPANWHWADELNYYKRIGVFK